MGEIEKARMGETTTELSATIVRNLGELQRLEGAWRALAHSLTEIPIFQLPEWVLTWWSYFGAGCQLYCIAVHDSGDLVGFVPLMMQRRFGQRTVSFIGASLNDRNSFVVNNANASRIRQVILQCLIEHATEWDGIELTNVGADSLPEWQDALASGSKRGHLHGAYLVLRPTPHPALPLPVHWQGYWDSMPAKRRKDLKRREHQLERDHGASYGLALTPAEVASELPRLLDLKRRSWQERNKLSKMNPIHLTPAFVGFLRDACTQLAQHHMVVVAYIKVQDTLIASRVAFITGSALVGYQRSYDAQFSRYAPGMLLDLHTLRFAIQSGLHTFDCGTGDEPYKFAFGAVPSFDQNLVVASPGLRGRILLNRHRMENQMAIVRDTRVAPLLRRYRRHAPIGQGSVATKRPSDVAEHADV